MFSLVNIVAEEKFCGMQIKDRPAPEINFLAWKKPDSGVIKGIITMPE